MTDIEGKHGESQEEEDLWARSIKKAKEKNASDRSEVEMASDERVNQYDQKQGNGGENVMAKSYKEMVLGGTVEGVHEVSMEDSDWESEEEEGKGEDFEVITVEEQKLGGYNCPLFILSKKEENRIQMLWRRGLIVKLQGRRIRYKALKTRLKQMWVKKDIINIIDLSNDYYLVTFSHDQDYTIAMLNGPWFIYDHYLTVKEWCPNFHPQSDTIKSAAVWVQIAELPIEYYDSKVHIGNKIRKTVKVDKNTVVHERGRYVGICVEVDLSKALLAMFMINGEKI